MKYSYLYLFIALALSIGSCKKEEKDATNYTVNGISDITLQANKSTTIPLNITHVSGNQENVSMTLNGLPANVTYEFSNQSGIPTYQSILTIKADYGQEGSYPLVLSTSSTSGVIKSFNFNLFLTPYDDCGGTISGSYTGYNTCYSTGTNLSIKKDPNKVDGIIIRFKDEDIPANINCNNKTIDIPLYTFATQALGTTINTELSGSGSFGDNNIVILNIKEKSTFSNGDIFVDNVCTHTVAK